MSGHERPISPGIKLSGRILRYVFTGLKKGGRGVVDAGKGFDLIKDNARTLCEVRPITRTVA